MLVKLRQLSIVSLAHAQKKVPYATLQHALGISNVRELEDMIIDTIYAGILEGRLDQHKGVRPTGLLLGHFFPRACFIRGGSLLCRGLSTFLLPAFYF